MSVYSLFLLFPVPVNRMQSVLTQATHNIQELKDQMKSSQMECLTLIERIKEQLRVKTSVERIMHMEELAHESVGLSEDEETETESGACRSSVVLSPMTIPMDSGDVSEKLTSVVISHEPISIGGVGVMGFGGSSGSTSIGG